MQEGEEGLGKVEVVDVGFVFVKREEARVFQEVFLRVWEERKVEVKKKEEKKGFSISNAGVGGLIRKRQGL